MATQPNGELSLSIIIFISMVQHNESLQYLEEYFFER